MSTNTVTVALTNTDVPVRWDLNIFGTNRVGKNEHTRCVMAALYSKRTLCSGRNRATRTGKPKLFGSETDQSFTSHSVLFRTPCTFDAPSLFIHVSPESNDYRRLCNLSELYLEKRSNDNGEQFYKSKMWQNKNYETSTVYMSDFPEELASFSHTRDFHNRKSILRHCEWRDTVNKKAWWTLMNGKSLANK